MILNSFTGNIWHLDVADSDKIGIKCLTYMGIFVSTTSTHSCLIWEMCSGTTRTGSFRRCAGVLSKARAPSSVLTSDSGTSVPYVMFILRFIWHTLSSKKSGHKHIYQYFCCFQWLLVKDGRDPLPGATTSHSLWAESQVRWPSEAWRAAPLLQRRAGQSWQDEKFQCWASHRSPCQGTNLSWQSKLQGCHEVAILGGWYSDS